MNPLKATQQRPVSRHRQVKHSGVLENTHTHTQNHINTKGHAKWTSQPRTRWDGWSVPLTPEALHRSAN